MLRRRASAFAIGACLLAATPATHTAHAETTEPLDVRLLGFNDLRGALTPPAGADGEMVNTDGSTVQAGGAAYLAAYVAQLRSQAPHSLLYSVGDNWGSSALESALFHDEPTVDVLNAMGVAASAVGNMELGSGVSELLRLQHGGCHPVDGCRFDRDFGGASFPFLAANLNRAGAPVTMPFAIDYVGTTPVGVIGVLPSDAPRFVDQNAVGDLEFGDELAAIDHTADVLDFFGVKAITVLLHKGDDSSPAAIGPDSCDLVSSTARQIAEQASPKVDVVFTAAGGHQYNCTVRDPAGNPRVFMQGASAGRAVSVVDLAVDPATGEVLRDRISSFNQIVSRDIAPDPQVEEIVGKAVSKVAAVANRDVGTVSADIPRAPAPSGESALGNLIADAQLATAAPAGAQLAFTNAGGIRADLSGTCVRYGEAYAVQPFGNPIRVVPLSGAQLYQLLDQQFQPRPDGTVWRETLAPSGNVGYRVDRSGERDVISDMTVDGIPVDPDAVYRVAVNDFLAHGGDGFTVLDGAQPVADAGKDTDALARYLTIHSPVAPPATDRITVVN